MANKRLFVTVGTTRFDKLISTLSTSEVLNKIERLGYKSILFQTGNGSYTKVTHRNLDIKYERYVKDFEAEIKNSDLVISHAGAGTCLEVLQCGKPLIVVVNEDLMDNHQLELAKHLSSLQYLYYCTCETLLETIVKDLKSLKPYPKADPNLFRNYIEDCMGFR